MHSHPHPITHRHDPALDALDARAQRAHAAALSLLCALLALIAALGHWSRHHPPDAVACALALDATPHPDPNQDPTRWRCLDPSAPQDPALLPPLPPALAFALGQPMDINAATAADLRQLDGLGPAKADAILALRAHLGGLCHLDDLTQAHGIGPQTLARWRGALSVNPQSLPPRCAQPPPPPLHPPRPPPPAQ